MRILVADIADEDFLLVVPALEVASCQFQQILSRRIRERSDVFFGDVADGFVVGAMRENDVSTAGQDT